MIPIEEMVREHVAEKFTHEKIHPSSLGGCDLKVVYQRRNTEETHPMDLETKWKLRSYSNYEMFFLSAFAANGVLISPPPGEAQHTLSWRDYEGHPDFLIKDADGRCAIVEVKSANPGAFKYKSMPYDNHKSQAWSYFVMARESFLDVGSIYIAYIARFDEGKIPEIEVYNVTPTKEEYEEQKEYMLYLERFSPDSDDWPDIPFKADDEHPFFCTRKDWRSGTRVINCPYYGQCWSTETDPDDDDDYLPF